MRLRVILAALCLSWGTAVASESMVGRSIVEVIALLETQGAEIYYSSDLIRPDMRVQAEPEAAGMKEILEEILAPFGLTTSPGPGGSLLIVRRAAGTQRQPGSVLGVVEEARTGRRIVGASVAVEGHGEPVRTSAGGQFHIIGLPPGRHRLVVDTGTNTGRATMEVAVQAGRTAVVEVEIVNPDVETLSTVVVSASRYGVAGRRGASLHYLPVEQIEQLPDFGDDPMRAVARLPGTATGGFTAKSNLRGGETGETLVRFDGLKLRNPYHLKDYQAVFSAIDPAIVNGLDVYTGGLPARLGNRMSGAVIIAPREAPVGRHHEISQSLFNSSALTAGSIGGGRGDYLLSGRRGNLDLLLDLTDPDLGDPSYLDFYGRLGLQATDSLRVSGNLLVFADDIRLKDSDEEEQAEGSYYDQYIWLRLDHDLGRGLTGHTLLSHTYLDSDREGWVDRPGVSRGTLDDSRTFNISALTTEWTWWAGDRIQLNAGGEVSRSRGDYDYTDQVAYDLLFLTPGTPDQPASASRFNLDPDGEQYAAFLEGRVGLTPRLVADIGLRWDRETLTEDGDHMWSPRLGAVYRLSDRTSLRAHWGRHYQAQGIEELQVSDGVIAYQRPQRSDHLILGMDQQLPAGMELRLEAYRKNMDRLRPRFENLLDTQVLLPELMPDRIRVDPEKATAQGVEVSLSRLHGGNLGWWLSYAWSEVKDDIQSRTEERSWDQTHAVKGGLAWERGPWQFSVAASWNTGWPTTSARLSATEPLPLVETGPRNGDRLGQYLALDARLAREWRLAESTLTGFVEVTNLTDHSNDCCVEYRVKAGTGDEDESWLDLDRDDYLGLFPSIGIVWRFGSSEGDL